MQGCKVAMRKNIQKKITNNGKRNHNLSIKNEGCVIATQPSFQKD